MTISRDTFDPAKNYKRIRYHQDRDEKTGAQNAQGKSQDLSQRILSEIL